MKSLVIIPVKNAYDTILDTVASIEALYNDIDILVIDYGSTDRTKYLLRNNCITHLEYFIDATYNKAVSTGLEYAHQNGYDIAIQWNQGNIFDPRDIAYALRTFENKKVDFVLGSRYVDVKAPFTERSTRRMSFNIKLLTGAKFTDPRLRFRAFGRKTMKAFKDSFYFDPGIETIAHLAKANYKFEEIQINPGNIGKINNNKGIINNSRATLLIMLTKPFKKVGKNAN